MAQIIRLSLSYQATNMGATLRFSLNPLISHINYHLLSRSQKDPHIYAVRQLSIKSNYIAWHENKTFKTKRKKGIQYKIVEPLVGHYQKTFEQNEFRPHFCNMI